MLAITRLPSPSMDRCELTFVARELIDVARANRQHAAYCEMLRECGADVVALPSSTELPDCAFVEDTAIVLDEVAVLCSLGAASRRGEIDAVAAELARHRTITRIDAPATIEGGDVLRVGRMLLVGRSRRTNQAGIDALERIACEYGYDVVPVPVGGCLHLKTACTALDESRLLVNPSWVDAAALKGFDCVSIPLDEPWGANVLALGGTVCLAASHVQTAEMLDQMGLVVRTVDVSEFAKTEAGVTCLSLLVC